MNNTMTKEDYLYNTICKCKKRLDALGIPYNNQVVFSINTRSKMRWGQTTKTNDKYSISISQLLLNGDTQEGLEDTILHELVHTCPGCMNHGNKWKAYVENINKAYGYKISRKSSPSIKGINILKMYKYVFKCNVCGTFIIRQRASDFTRHYNNYRCGKCGGKLIKVIY